MKILIINTFDVGGGAARAAYRLHQALLNEGIESLMLVQIKSSSHHSVITAHKNDIIQNKYGKLRRILDSFPKLFYHKRSNILYSPAWVPFGGVINTIREINPDVIHFHWICGGMIRINDIKNITKPIVWTLHDMWPMTGGCHLNYDCKKYQNQCQECPNLKSITIKDISYQQFCKKLQIYENLRSLTVVGLSRWISHCARESRLLSQKRIVDLPNPIDSSIFKPTDKKYARILWKLPLNKNLILFGAINATSDFNKGYHLILESLLKLKINNLELVVFGSPKPDDEPEFPFPVHYLGIIYDDQALIQLYSAVDVVIVPSLFENLSNTIMESLSCGTPVVAFNIGGNGDMIDHCKNGYLAEPFNPEDLARGIEFVLSHPDYSSLSKNAREKVLNCFDSKVVAKQYIELYKSLIPKNYG